LKKKDVPFLSKKTSSLAKKGKINPPKTVPSRAAKKVPASHKGKRKIKKDGNRTLGGTPKKGTDQIREIRPDYTEKKITHASRKMTK